MSKAKEWSLAERAKKLAKIAAIRMRLKLAVDYNLLLAEMIQAGKYKAVDDGLTRIFPHVPRDASEEFEALLVSFVKYSLGTHTVVFTLDQMGLRPAALPMLCALGATQPYLQEDSPIVALGSQCINAEGETLSPYLDLSKRYGGRTLEFRVGDYEWSSIHLFLAVRK